MSIITVTVNLPKQNISKTFLQDVSKTVAKIFQQDPSCIMAKLSANAFMSYGANNADTAVFITIQTITYLNNDINQECTSAVTEFVSKALNVPSKRIIILFTEEIAADLSLNGTSLHQY